MKVYEIGDIVDIKDGSYSFGIKGEEFSSFIPTGDERKGAVVIKTGLDVMLHSTGNRVGKYPEINDLLVRTKQGNYWFTASRHVEPAITEIDLRYFCNGKDVTDKISWQTRKILRETE